LTGNNVSFHKTAIENNSKANFHKCLNLVYTYAGTQFLYFELPKVTCTKDLKIGDILIKPGSFGAVVMIVNIFEDNEVIDCLHYSRAILPPRAFLFYKNPENINISTRFEFTKGIPLQIPTDYFVEAKFVRFK
jgi:hypothetical protein